MKRQSSRKIGIRLPAAVAAKLDTLARRVTPKGSKPNVSMAIRNLIEKEVL